jgi:hypothetical protein
VAASIARPMPARARAKGVMAGQCMWILQAHERGASCAEPS